MNDNTDRQLNQQLIIRHARNQSICQKLGLKSTKPQAALLHRSGEMNQPSNTKEWAGSKPIENYLSGKTLREEIRMQCGPCALESVKQNYAEVLNQDEKLTVNSSPKQRLIDKVLARRRFQQFVKEKEHRMQNRKLEEDKESLKKEMRKLQLQKKHLGTEFIVPSYTHDDQSALQARIIQIRNNLPAMEHRIQELSEEFSRDGEKKLTSYNEYSVFEGAEPYQIRDINMVHTILSDVVEKLMDDYIRKVPDGMDPFTADQLAWKTVQEADKVMKEVMMDRVTNLVMEQFVLEVTLELTSEVAHEFYNVKQMSQSLAFGVIFNAVQEVGKQRRKQSGNEKVTVSSDHLINLLLQQQKDRELHRKGLWGHSLDIQH